MNNDLIRQIDTFYRWRRRALIALGIVLGLVVIYVIGDVCHHYWHLYYYGP